MKLLGEYNSPTRPRHLNEMKIYAELHRNDAEVRIKSLTIT
nr:MAG TPA: hypothetical protein [Bacteriophage sp.]